MPVDVQKILEGLGLSGESLDRIRLGRGIVGKTSYVALSVIALLGLLIWVLRGVMNPALLLWVAGAALFVFLVYFIGVLIFALRNPGAALLEGAELLRWQQYELAAKGLPQPPATPLILDPVTPRQQLSGRAEPEN